MAPRHTHVRIEHERRRRHTSAYPAKRRPGLAGRRGVGLRLVRLARLEDHDLRGGLALDLLLEGLGVRLDRGEGVVVARDHGRGADQAAGVGGVLAVHREVAADRDQRDVGAVALADQAEVAEQRGVAEVVDRLVRRCGR